MMGDDEYDALFGDRSHPQDIVDIVGRDEADTIIELAIAPLRVEVWARRRTTFIGWVDALERLIDHDLAAVQRVY